MYACNAFPERWDLASQVLECIRHRHGLQEFAGGRLLLDPEYEYDETAGSTSVVEDNSGNKGLLFPGLRLLHVEPIVIGVDDFFTPEECDDYISRSVSPPLREYVSRAGMGPFEQPAALDSGQVCMYIPCVETKCVARPFETHSNQPTAETSMDRGVKFSPFPSGGDN